MRFTGFHAVRWLAVVIAAVSVSAVVGCGNSAYHRAEATVPGDLNERLTVRVQEARVAALDASRVFADQQAMSPQLADRADAAAWDYSKRVASVQDVMRKLATPDLQGQKVLMSLERADTAVAAAVEKAQGPERPQLWSEATTALETAVSSADNFLATRKTPHAQLTKPEAN